MIMIIMIETDANLAGPLSRVLQLRAGDDDAALVPLVVPRQRHRVLQRGVTRLPPHRALQQIFLRTFTNIFQSTHMFPLPLEVALPDPLVEVVRSVGVSPAAVLVVAVRLAHQPHPPPGLQHL